MFYYQDIPRWLMNITNMLLIPFIKTSVHTHTHTPSHHTNIWGLEVRLLDPGTQCSSMGPWRRARPEQHSTEDGPAFEGSYQEGLAILPNLFEQRGPSSSSQWSFECPSLEGSHHGLWQEATWCKSSNLSTIIVRTFSDLVWFRLIPWGGKTSWNPGIMCGIVLCIAC